MNILVLLRPWPLVVAAISAGTAQAQWYLLPEGGGDLVGQIETITVGTEETLADVAREHNIGHEEIRNANPAVEFWLPARGAEIVLPKRHILPKARREGIVLNVPEMRLYYFPRACKSDGECLVITHPVSIGRMDWQTPLGTTRVTSKVPNPTWRPPESIRREAAEEGHYLPETVPPGPNNPLGAYAIYLALPGYRIHGTNRPFGVGMRATHGCVRMYPEDIEALYKDVPIGTEVQIVSQPIKFGWQGETLFMEAHPPLEEDVEAIAHLADIALNALQEVRREHQFALNEPEFERVLKELRGIPVAISIDPASADGRAGDSQPGAGIPSVVPDQG